METRAEKLTWCKQRALKELDAPPRSTDLTYAANVFDPKIKAACLASMSSDVKKMELYTPGALAPLMAMGCMCATAGEMRRWVEGFG